jgi:hypothetical protein
MVWVPEASLNTFYSPACSDASGLGFGRRGNRHAMADAAGARVGRGAAGPIPTAV